MGNFTPGPWEIGEHSTDGKRDGSVVFQGYNKWGIAKLWASWRFSSDAEFVETDANARLIAAAPDLYAIAKELVEWEQDPDRYRGDLADLAQDARKILE